MTLRYDNYSTEAEYKEALFLTILNLEEKGKIELEPYSDNPVRGGYATIGVGFKIDSNWDDILKAFGFDIAPQASINEKKYIKDLKALVGLDQKLTKAGMSTLRKKLDAIMTKRANDTAVVSAIPGIDKPTIFAFNDFDQVEVAFQAIAGKRDDILMKWLGETTRYSIVPQSNERITLLSLVYNNLIGFKDMAQKTPKSESLLKAIKAGNRAEAWFEIRYRSNIAGSGHEKGTAIRRFYEADFFGLYNPGEATTENKILEYKTVMRMYTFNKTKIDAYERTWGKYVAVANTEYSVPWIGTLENNLQPAKDYLISSYAFGTIDGEIIIGAGLDTYAYKEKAKIDDNLTGSAKADLIFGEKGNDVIHGGQGNDEIYGGQGKDHLYGDGGKDILVGGDQDDILEGGTEDDTLYGGEGNDTYIINDGDGNDTIEDKQGKNTVKLCKEVISVFWNVKKDNGDWEWVNTSGKLKAYKNGTDLIVKHENGTMVTLNEDFEWGDFGTSLIDVPDNPTTSLTITGDLAPIDFDPGTPGVQVHYDTLGNVITDPNTPEPDRADTLYDSAGNDLIIGGGGNDRIRADNGGDDWLKGGSGNDGIVAGSGRDILEGGGVDEGNAYHRISTLVISPNFKENSFVESNITAETRF